MAGVTCHVWTWLHEVILPTESYTVGLHEFYLGYAASRDDVLLCLESNHFHPTEVISDKISAVLHISPGVRWDSDHDVPTTLV